MLQVDQHPGGGARIMLAAGGAIDPFWAMYAQHKTAEVRKILETYRIGDLVSTSHLHASICCLCHKHYTAADVWTCTLSK